MSGTMQSRFFAAPDGLNLHALVLGEDAATAQQPTPIVCLPGLTRPARDFVVLAQYLYARTPRRIVSLDYRGRGGSDWDPEWRNYSLPVEYVDILAMLDQLKLGSAIFIGTSRGGLHAMTLASLSPERVKALALNDIGPELGLQGLAKISAYIGRLPVLRTVEQAVEHFKGSLGGSFPAVPDEDWRIYADISLNDTPERLRLSYDPQLARTMDNFDPAKPLPDLWELFQGLTAPVLALRGENSDLLSPEVFARMAAVHPRCQTHVVPGQGHAPLLLDKPTLERIAAFIDEADRG
ncbi:alpha/beta hydrolase [uncultured Rhodoblastus sp.]|uniref:alpha/beta fold hydrolase n=1 Tax=uncultured Rhodoblastus sp. TaxID=543037 RepID=UPI0025E808F2|nr:alpha/beta hydrolase [uncultured Rhodoblastus sp.]